MLICGVRGPLRSYLTRKPWITSASGNSHDVRVLAEKVQGILPSNPNFLGRYHGSHILLSIQKLSFAVHLFRYICSAMKRRREETRGARKVKLGSPREGRKDGTCLASACLARPTLTATASTLLSFPPS